ncbi:SDR family oxidoreductase [Patulibacter defluvii]|uniref:SDR family oxidoreductase n=1 Tax=Patulibacter defluvii TaxID=3095358 RepID=UPI002A74D92C|nr:SDR family oxidoreductase [Patulibacter sp. DM4]
MTGIQGRVVLITGGGRGIGLATARALHARGATVVLGDVDVETAEDAAAALGERALAAPLDVTDPASFDRFASFAEERAGTIDVLVNNAGIMPLGPFVDESMATARRVLEVNVLGAMAGMKRVLPAMLERGAGHVVNVASVAGKAPAPGGASYCASKAAIVSLTETARVEHAGRGVAFTCVMPSFTATELIAGTKGTRFLATVTPEAVAAAIAGAIARPRPDVYVPRTLPAVLRLQALLGRRGRDAMNRALGADRTFLEVDQAARADYDARIAAPSAPAPTPTDERAPAAR